MLTLEGAHGPVIHAVTAAAAAHGARAGMRLTDARALFPQLTAIPADPDGDRALLDRLARWAMRWSPLVEVDGDDGLRLDVSGAAHLFGGERGLIADVAECFARLGLTVRSAIAPTPGAAWALCRFSSPRRGEGDSAQQSGVRAREAIRTGGPPLPCPLPLGERELAAALAPLPVAALGLSPQATRTLERLGLKTIGTLAGIERRSLARRFRDPDNPLDALDRALGRKPDPLTAVQIVRPPRSLLRLAEPVADPAAAAQALAILIPRLVAELEARKLGVRHLSLAGFRVDGTIASASVATAIASRDPGHLQRLLADKAEALDPGFGFDAFALTADWAEALGAAQESLVEEPSGSAEVARLIDRLSVKLGGRAVRSPEPFESHLPERASGWNSALASVRGAPATKLAMTASRPQRLLDRPEGIAVIYATPEGLPRRFVWRRAVHDIARVQGPERIAPEWWRQPSTARLRDYYQVEDNAGRRYWIYREGVIGDGRGGAPDWFIHGLFG
ncbi:MAG: DNA polymerase Y family protein [Pseudomonadota bacterium]